MTVVVVIGHVEWVELLRVDHLPRPGELQDAQRESPRAGGSAVIAASVLAEEGAEVLFIGAVGDDGEGDAAVAQLRDRRIPLAIAHRPGPTRRVTVLLDRAGERTILTSGERWAPRVLAEPAAAAVTLDALVFSADDPQELELAQLLQDGARLLVGTEGASGGRWWGEQQGRWAPAPLPGPVADSYGCGDAFAAGFTLGLARGQNVAEAAALGARCGAAMLSRPGAP